MGSVRAADQLEQREDLSREQSQDQVERADGHAATTKRKGTGARLHMPVVHCGGPQSTTLHTAPLAFHFEVSWSTARRGVGGGPG